MKRNESNRDGEPPATTAGPGGERDPGRLVAGGLRPEIAAWYGGYLPNGPRRVAWPLIEGFVTSAILKLRPETPSTAQLCVWALVSIGTWGVEHEVTIDPEVLLHPDTVERFCLTAVRPKARRTMRSTLRRIGPQLTRRAPWVPRQEPIRYPGLAAPYTPAEVSALRIDAHRQPSYDRTRTVRAILALGIGVGLDGRWSMKIRGSDIVRDGDVVLVDVPPPAPRLVPALAEWEDELLELASIAGHDILVGGLGRWKNKASWALRHYESGPGRPRLHASRARSTWLLHHLTVGTRLPEFVRAAGVKQVSSLDGLLGLVQPLSEDARREMLRGRP
jgi:hypothetical protein